MASDDPPTIGSDNTYVGEGPVPAMGDGNTIYTLANANGSVLLNRGGTAIGAGARADSTSVAVGARALGGDLPQLFDLLAQLQQVFDHAGAVEAAHAVAGLADETGRSSPDERKIGKLWTTVKAAAATNEAISLVARITPLLAAAPHHL
jgi:hypothetical protein